MHKSHLGFRGLWKAALLTALIGSTLIPTSEARAALLLEPYAGLELNQSVATVPVYGDGKFNSVGPHFGARLGYSIPLFFFALDYDYGSLNATAEASDDLRLKSGTLTRSNLFAEVGVKLPLVRAYVGYGLLDEWTFKGGADSQDLKLKGNSFKFGAGFSGFPFVVVWIDCIMSNFNKFAVDGTERDIKDGEIIKAAKATAYMLTVSIPFEF